MDSVYAATGTLLEAPLSGLLPPGEYCAELALADEEWGVSADTECLPFYVEAAEDPEAGGAGRGSQDLPLWLPSSDGLRVAAPIAVIAGIGGALLAAALVLAVRRRRRDPKPPSRPPAAATGDRARS